MSLRKSNSPPEPSLKAFERCPEPSPRYCGFLNAVFTRYISNKGGLTVVGADNIPEEGPYIVSPNHISHLDTAVVGKAVLDAVGHNLHFVAKSEFWEGKFGWATGRFVEHGGGFPINRSVSLENQPRVLERLNQIFIVNKEPFCIYPQGKRMEQAEPIGKLKGSIGYLAIKYGVPVIPAGIAGTVEKNTMTIVFQEPLQAEQIDFDLAKPRANNRISGLANAFRWELADNMQDAKSEAESYRKSLLYKL